MARKPPEIVGTAEAATILGIHPPSVTRLKNNGRMPQPVVELASTPVWRKTDVERLRDTGDHNGRRPRPLTLVGTSEAAKLVGVNKSQIGRWRRGGSFPAPCAELRAGPVWWVADIERFAANR